MECAAARWIQGGGDIALQDDAIATLPSVGFRHRREERTRVRMRWVFEEISGRCRLHHLAEIHHRDPIAEMLHHPKVVSDKEIREPELLLKFGEQIQHLRLDRDVQRRDRLVQDNEFRVEHKCTSDPHTLALAARELVWISTRALRS